MRFDKPEPFDHFYEKWTSGLCRSAEEWAIYPGPPAGAGWAMLRGRVCATHRAGGEEAAKGGSRACAGKGSDHGEGVLAESAGSRDLIGTRHV